MANVNNELHKKPRARMQYTKKQIAEIEKCMDDPIYFIDTYVKLKHPKHGSMPFKLFPYQERMIRTYQKYNRVISMLSRQCGKALTLDTPVYTKDGWKTVSDLSVGDVVYGRDGKETNVIDVTEVMFDDPCFEMEFDIGGKISCDAGHLWIVERDGTEELLTTYEIQEQLENSEFRIRATKPITMYDGMTVQDRKKLLESDISEDERTIIEASIGTRCEYHRIVAVNEIEKQEVKCVFVDNEDSTFLVGKGFVPTHNSQTASAFLLWWAIFKSDQAILIASNKQSSANDIMRRLFYSYEELPMWIKPGLEKNEVKTKMFDNGSTVEAVATTEDSGRGRSTSVLYLDEFAFVRPSIQDEFWASIYPTLSCLHGDTEIITSFGPMKISSLLPDDAKPNIDYEINGVRVFDGVSFHDVATCLKTEKTDMWKVILEDDSYVIGTKFHPLYTYKPNDFPTYETINRIEPGDRILCYRNRDMVKIKVKEVVYHSHDHAYDISVPATRRFLQNGMLGSNSGGKAIITSTPASDEDQFSKIWFNAEESELSDKWVQKNVKALDDVVDEDDDYETIFETSDARIVYESELGQRMGKTGDEGNEIRFVRFFTEWTSVPNKISKKGKILSYRDENFKLETIHSAGFTEEKFEVEYECQFRSSGNTLVNGQSLSRLNSVVRKPKFVDKHGCRWYSDLSDGNTHTFFVALDPSEGMEGDNSAIQIIGFPSMIQVAEWNSNTTSQQDQAKVLASVLKRLQKVMDYQGIDDGRIYYSIERNGIGRGVINLVELIEDKIPGIFIDSTDATKNRHGSKIKARPTLNLHRGLITTNYSKVTFAKIMKEYIEKGKLRIYSRFLLSELKHFVSNKTTLGADGSSGVGDDLVMAMVLAFMVMQEAMEYEPEIADVITKESLDEIDFDVDEDELNDWDDLM